MTARETKSITVNPDLWKQLQKFCIDHGTSISNLFENFARNILNSDHADPTDPPKREQLSDLGLFDVPDIDSKPINQPDQKSKKGFGEFRLIE